DAQIVCQALSPRRGPRQPKQPRRVRPRVPDVIARRFDDLVCVVGEANAWPYRGAPSRHPDELVHWVAYRVATGETFERIAAPAGPLSPSTAFHSAPPEQALPRGGPS